MKKHLLMTAAVMAAVMAAVGGAVYVAPAGAADNNYGINKSVDGKFTIKADIGYLYNFASKWNMDGTAVNGTANGTVGYGASLGYIHQSGFGLSADYLGFNNKWNTNSKRYDASFHALTLTPSYRFALDADKNWGLKIGLGVGLSLSDITWGNVGGAANALSAVASSSNAKSAGKMAGGAVYSTYTTTSGDGGSLNNSYHAFTACGHNKTDTPHVTKIYDSVGFNGHQGECELSDGTFTKTHSNGTITDAEIARMLLPIFKDGAPYYGGVLKVGTADNHNGGAAISYGVLSSFLTLLASASGSNDAELAKAALMGGDGIYTDGRQAEGITYQAPSDRNTTITLTITETAASQYLSNSNIAAMKAAGVAFAYEAPPPPPPAPAGKGKDDAGFVLVPQVALEYDNGRLHGDINVRYIHAMKNVKYDGTGELMGKTYSVNAGPVGLFIGAGFGVNF